MINKNKTKEFMKDKGYYLVLALCIIGASVAAWATANDTLNTIEEQNKQLTTDISNREDILWQEIDQNQQPIVTVEVADVVEDVEKPSSQSTALPSASSSSTTGDSSNDSSESQELGQKLQQSPYILPLESLEVINGYSNDVPVKNPTLNVWRVHNAVDFKGELGCRVMAVSDGVVTLINTDPLWGGQIEITHPDGYVSCYSGVVALDTLKEGDNVSSGQKIGELGEIVAEISMEPHLHFAFRKDNLSIDPGKLLDLS